MLSGTAIKKIIIQKWKTVTFSTRLGSKDIETLLPKRIHTLIMDDVEAYLWLQTHHVLNNDEDQVAKAALGLIATMAVHSQEERARRRAKKRADLVRANLLPNPRFGTPWQQLYRSKSDCAYIITMGFDVATFHKILDASFARQWYTVPIACSNVKSTGCTCPTARSLDAAGALGLVLHYLRMISTILPAGIVISKECNWCRL